MIILPTVVVVVLHPTLVFEKVPIDLPTLPIDELLAIHNAAWPRDDFVSEHVNDIFSPPAGLLSRRPVAQSDIVQEDAPKWVLS